MLRIFCLLRLLKKFCWIVQHGWINANLKLFMNAVCSHKLCMLYPLLQYWGDLHLFLLVTLKPSRSPCARRARTFLAHHATQSWALATAVVGSTSTVLPWLTRLAAPAERLGGFGTCGPGARHYLPSTPIPNSNDSQGPDDAHRGPQVRLQLSWIQLLISGSTPDSYHLEWTARPRRADGASPLPRRWKERRFKGRGSQD
jgi:hypothetical protein